MPVTKTTPVSAVPISTEVKNNPFKKQIYPPQTQLFEASKTVDDGSSK